MFLMLSYLPLAFKPICPIVKQTTPVVLLDYEASQKLSVMSSSV